MLISSPHDCINVLAKVKGITARVRRLTGVLFLMICCTTVWADRPGVEVSVHDSDDQPLAGARVQLKIGEAIARTAETDGKGHAEFRDLKPGRYTIFAAKDGFQLAQRDDLEVTLEGSTAIDVTLVPALARKERIEVAATTNPVEQGASTPNTLSGQTAKELPGRPATAADALPMLPGVVRKPDGGLQISASGEHRSSLIVNSADVTDPATGQFGLTVPIDVVDTVSVYQTPFLAEYGRFTAGLVSVETRRGGDKWKWELNDPFPDFYIRSYHLRGLRDATPRINVEGPLIARKLYFSKVL
jgi:hypothetical protein